VSHSLKSVWNRTVMSNIRLMKLGKKKCPGAHRRKSRARERERERERGTLWEREEPQGGRFGKRIQNCSMCV